MVKYRLQVTEPGLLKLLLPESGDRLRKVAIAVSELALDASGLHSPLVAQAIGELSEGKPIQPALRAELQHLVDELDEEYFKLKEEAESADSEPSLRDDDPTAPWRVMFHKARAAAAVLFACEDDPLFAAAEATDEARVAVHDDVDAVRIAVLTALR